MCLTGKEGHPLEEFTAPRKWQEKILRDMEVHIQRNNGKVDYEMFRQAIASERNR